MEWSPPHLVRLVIFTFLQLTLKGSRLKATHPLNLGGIENDGWKIALLDGDPLHVKHIPMKDLDKSLKGIRGFIRHWVKWVPWIPMTRWHGN